jgi:hypothetical protein
MRLTRFLALAPILLTLGSLPLYNSFLLLALLGVLSSFALHALLLLACFSYRSISKTQQ